ncbi:MAG: pantetheine-phosphate adenylyltransferase [Neisseria sp.]|nr:pantetheine-phosphate adenylyltransferase [Neisseria sp.]
MTTRQIKRAVYAGSFDPPTNGHLWMIRTAQALFDELVVAIGENPDKRSTYSIEEREEMLEALTAEFPHVTISTMRNRFLVEYAQSIDADYIIRGIRTASDYEYERSMRYINSDLHPEISTFFLMPPREFAEVSSTMVKGLVGPKNWQEVIRRYVPDAVYEKILQDHERKKHTS